jgi:preprotein translocase subunit YajC
MNIFALFFQDGGGGSIFGFLVPIALMIGIFYFLVIMPQRRQQQELKNMIAELKSGEEVVTNGGVIGKIIEVRETSFIIRSADKSNLEIAKSAVVGRRGEAEKK